MSTALYLSNRDTIIPLCIKAKEIAERNLATNPTGILKNRYLLCLADALNNIGFVYNSQGNIPQALENFHNSLKIRDEIGDKTRIAISLNNIGFIYRDQDDIEKALEYFQKSLDIKEDLGNKKGMAVSYNNIGLIHHELGDSAKTILYFQKSLKIREELGNKAGIAESLNNIGCIYKTQGEIIKALQHFQKGLKIVEEIGDKEGMATALNNIGNIEFERGAFLEALKNGTQGLQIAREIGSPDLMSFNAQLLSKVAREKGEYEDALIMYELHIKMRDSIKNQENQKAAIRQQTKYEFEKAQLVKDQKEKEAARIVAEETYRRDNLQYSVILIALLVIGGLLSVIGRFSMPVRVVEGLIFFSFLILFEFILVLGDPCVENWTGGAPGLKLLINAGVAALIFPLHAFFGAKLKGRLVKNQPTFSLQPACPSEIIA
ncbi:MAG: tetratricopeptide repeat protein [Flavobacteriales bacterium]|nr:tetratricopeptide repeat protein [Flavobacteriales bacterium]